ncbi:MAG: hypothetical protein WCP36_05210 [Methanomicrobiales archaeon]
MPDEVLDIQTIEDKRDIPVGLSGRVALQSGPGTLLRSVIIPALFSIILIIQATIFNGTKKTH